MMLLKSCPRCHGDMMREELLGEVEIVCLQCGHRTSYLPPTEQPELGVSLTKKAA